MSTAEQVAADLGKYATRTAVKVVAAVHRHGHRLHAGVKRRAAEPRTAVRPGDGSTGPRLMTGDYNRSIALHLIDTPARAEATVATNKVQGPRLELGFDGTDALGRTYHQQPYPHFAPALDAEAAPFKAAVHAATNPGTRR